MPKEFKTVKILSEFSFPNQLPSSLVRIPNFDSMMAEFAASPPIDGKV
jgi:hypothetical protein